MKFLKCVFILSLFALFIAGCNQSPSNTTANVKTEANAPTVAAAPTAQTDELAAARKHYDEKCSSCHKENGTGGKVVIEGKTHNADDLTTAKMIKMDDSKYFKYVKEGIPDEGMPSFKDQLSDDEIRNVVKFIRRDIQKN